MIFDAHAHYDDAAFDDDRDELLSKMPDMGVSHIVNASSDIASSRASIALAEKYGFIYAAIGVHPQEAGDAAEDYIETLRRMAKHEKVVAIGEIGLDYHYENAPRDVQKRVFCEQIALAKELNLPFVVHERDAAGDTTGILAREGVGKDGGIMHCFSGSIERAREMIKLGMYISLGGVVTFKNAVKSVEVAKEIPLDTLLLETDCPYLAPTPFRGKRNDSTLIEYVAEKIAEIRGVMADEIKSIALENAKRIYKIQ